MVFEPKNDRICFKNRILAYKLQTHRSPRLLRVRSWNLSTLQILRDIFNWCFDIWWALCPLDRCWIRAITRSLSKESQKWFFVTNGVSGCWDMTSYYFLLGSITIYVPVMTLQYSNFYWCQLSEGYASDNCGIHAVCKQTSQRIFISWLVQRSKYNSEQRIFVAIGRFPMNKIHNE